MLRLMLRIVLAADVVALAGAVVGLISLCVASAHALEGEQE